MPIHIRIMSSNPKWTSFKYLSSNSQSRMPTEKLKTQIEQGIVQASNIEDLHTDEKEE